MPKRASLSNHVLANGRTAHLLWVQSPRLHIEGKQWRTVVTFVEEDGFNFNQVELPWGVLPNLRLGQWFEDGLISNLHPPVGQRYELEIHPHTPMTVCKAAEIIPFDINHRVCRENGEENCFVFALPNFRVIPPVIECVRALMIPCKFLAYGILQPDYFRRIVTSNHLQVERKRLELGFSTELACNSLSPAVVAHIARLLHDPAFYQAWNSVHVDRLAVTGLCDAPAHQPLTFKLPMLAPTWAVRALLCEGGVLVVLEILNVQPNGSLPFTDVVFTHPKLVKRREEKKKSKSGLEKAAKMADESGGSNEFDMSPTPPKQPREPRLVRTPPFAVSYHTLLSIHKTVSTEQPSNDPAPARKQMSERRTSTPNGDAKISLSDQGGRGDALAAEFSPDEDEPIDCLPGQGLKEFSRVVICLRDEHPKISVKWLLRPLSGQRTTFTVVGEQPRMYAAVRLQRHGAKPSIICWLLEVGRSDRFVLSTLVFRFVRNGNKRESEVAIENLLKDLLDVNGWWRRDKLPELIGSTLSGGRLIQHVNRRTETRARRLYREVIDVIGTGR